MARGLPFTYGPSRTAPKSSTARAMGVISVLRHFLNSVNSGLPRGVYSVGRLVVVSSVRFRDWGLLRTVGCVRVP